MKLSLSSFSSLLPKCRDKAQNAGHKYFSIRYFGECYAGSDTTSMLSAVDDITTHSDKCVTGDGKYTANCTSLFTETCVGVESVHFVYWIV